MASSTSSHIAATSSSPAGSSPRLRSPIAWYRTAQCPTIPPTFTPLGIRSTLARYSPYVCQSQGSPLRIAAAGMSSTDSIISARYSRSSGRHGANVTPQFPITTVVTPCQHDGLPIGSHASCASRCVWMSTKPGVTTRPSASISSTARSPCSSPIAEIRSPTMPTSAKTPGPPVPSTIKPSRTITSNAVIYPPPPRPGPPAPRRNDATADRGAKNRERPVRRRRLRRSRPHGCRGRCARPTPSGSPRCSRRSRAATSSAGAPRCRSRRRPATRPGSHPG